MTSSESAPRLLAQGRLHPALLVLRLLDGVRAAVFPAVIGIVSGQWWLVGVAVLLFGVQMSYALARYLTFEYRLTTDELVTREGILERQERRIPVNRIQDLNFEASLLRRVLGLVVVSVETASGQGAEARLDSLSKRDAEAMREALYQTRAGAQAPVAPPPEVLLFRARPGELFLLGLTNNRVGVILGAIFGVWELLNQLQLSDRASGLASTFFDRLAAQGLPTLALVSVAVVLLALIAGWTLSIAASFLLFAGFTLTAREQVLVRRYGLITRRAHTLQQRRVQRALVEQNWLRRLLGVATVRADSAGGTQNVREQEKTGLDVVVPLAERPRAEAIVPVLLPGITTETVAWQRVSQRVIWRVFLKGCTVVVLLLGAGWPLLGPLALGVLCVLPCAWIAGVLAWHRLGFALPEQHVALRWGLLGSYRAFIPLRKVQGVALRADPWDRLLGLARLTVYVAGGSPTTLAHLPAGEARDLLQRLGLDAGRARFVW